MNLSCVNLNLQIHKNSFSFLKTKKRGVWFKYSAQNKKNGYILFVTTKVC